MRKQKQTPEELREVAEWEFVTTILIAFNHEKTPLNSRVLVKEAVTAYFESKPEEKKVLEDWATRGCFQEWEESIWVKTRIFAMVKFCREEMNLEWVSDQTRFAYDYSSFK